MSKIASILAAAALVLAIAAAVTVYVLFFRGPAPLELEESLVIYAHESLSQPLEAIASDYRERYQVQPELRLGKGAEFFLSAAARGDGDLILPPGSWTLDELNTAADGEEYIAERLPLAVAWPIVVLADEKTAEVKQLQDLLGEKLQLALLDPDRASLGTVLKETIDPGLWTRLWEQKKVTAASLADVEQAITDGQANAGIVWRWRDQAEPRFARVKLDALEGASRRLSWGISRQSTKATTALHFARFACAPETGAPYFKQAGLDTIEGDPWQHRQRVTVYCSRLVQPLLEQSIAEFERREGCLLTARYADGQALLDLLKEGRMADLLLAADPHTMNEAEKWFTARRHLSSSELVLVTPPGNPRRIKLLPQLQRTATRVGMCDPEQHALALAIKRHLIAKRVYNLIAPNIRYAPATIEELLELVRAGDVDAALMLRCEAALAGDEVEVVELKHDGLEVRQFLATACDSPVHWTAQRLIEHLCSPELQQAFETRGFNWHLPQ